MHFSICSQNMGNSVRDYLLLDKHVHAEKYINDPDRVYSDDRKGEREKAETKAAEALKDVAQVYCFQEALDTERGEGKELERPLFTALQEKNFTFIYSKNRQVALAFDPNTFEDITARVIDKQAFVVATAVVKETKQTIAFASIWAAGLPLYPEVEKDKEESAKFGNDECEEVLGALDDLKEESDTQVVCGDFNVTYETYRPRLDLFSNRDFTVFRTNEGTEVNSNEPDHAVREIDYGMVRENIKGEKEEKIKNIFQTIIERLLSLFIPSTSLSISASIPKGFEGWDPEKNGSDHKPILLEIKPRDLTVLERFLALFSQNSVDDLPSPSEEVDDTEKADPSIDQA